MSSSPGNPFFEERKSGRYTDSERAKKTRPDDGVGAEQAELIEQNRGSQSYTKNRRVANRVFNSWKSAIRPWSHFFRLSNFRMPACLDGYLERFKLNATYFIANYAIICFIFMICSVMTSFWLLLSTLILALLIYIIYIAVSKKPLKIGGVEIPSWFLYALAFFITLPLFIFAHVGYIIYCAVVASLVIIIVHASFYEVRILKPELSIIRPPEHSAALEVIEEGGSVVEEQSSQVAPENVSKNHVHFIDE